ncbi:MAG TPA: aminotransferase class IV [Caulobacteraceae bacterium]|nr:aminotransferase class IV [Caulobacteraceae bacterium]
MIVPLDDRGLLLGDGLFETLLAVDGRLTDFDAHARRLDRGCAVLGLPAPGDDQLWQAAEAALETAGLGQGRAAVRLTWTAGSGGRGLDRPEPPFPRLFAAAAAAPPAPAGPARLATAGVRRNADSPASRLKTLAYLDNVLARREAVAAGADEAVMLNTRGEVACAAAGNLFWFEGERLVTPALACGVLDGVVRGRVLAAARSMGMDVEEAAAGPARLAAATGVFLTNSLVGLRRGSRLDGRVVEPAPGLAALEAALT